MGSGNPIEGTCARRVFFWIAGGTLVFLGALGLSLQAAIQRGPRKMLVTTVDSHGRQVGPLEVVWLPEAEHVRANALGHVQEHVDRLLSSTARFSSLMIFSPDGRRGCALHYTDGRVSISLTVEWRQMPEQEKAIRRLFASEALPPAHDYLAGNGGVADATRVLDYTLPADGRTVSRICERVLQEIYGVTDSEPLDYTYQEDV